jgi:hypothetical protein
MNAITPSLAAILLGVPHPPITPCRPHQTPHRADSWTQAFRSLVRYDMSLRALAAGYSARQGEGVLILDLTSAPMSVLHGAADISISFTNWLTFDEPLDIESIVPNDAKERACRVMEDGFSVCAFGPMGLQVMGHSTDVASQCRTDLLRHRQFLGWPQDGASPVFRDENTPLYINEGKAQHAPPRHPGDYEEWRVATPWPNTQVTVNRFGRSLSWAAHVAAGAGRRSGTLVTGLITSSTRMEWPQLNVMTTQTVRAAITESFYSLPELPTRSIDQDVSSAGESGVLFSPVRIDLGRAWPMAN